MPIISPPFRAREARTKGTYCGGILGKRSGAISRNALAALRRTSGFGSLSALERAGIVGRAAARPTNKQDFKNARPPQPVIRSRMLDQLNMPRRIPGLRRFALKGCQGLTLYPDLFSPPKYVRAEDVIQGSGTAVPAEEL